MSKAADDVIAERERQKSIEGWTAEHDDLHIRGEMALAAASYAMWSFPSETTTDAAKAIWPWSDEWFKPKDMRRDLVRAAALIIAEIERFDRHQRLAAHIAAIDKKHPTAARRSSGGVL